MIDLRSDTVTRPDDAMRKAMAFAEVGDDVFGEDPTVGKLEARVAEVLGKEAALYVPSGVMANQISIKAQTKPGDEIIAEEQAHILLYESGAAPVISGVQVRSVRGSRGLFTPDDIRAIVRTEDQHVAPVRLVCLENTHNKAGGTVLPLDGMQSIHQTAEELGLSTHLDGARLWNASVALGVAPIEIARHADTVSVCFSKGLGAPVGSAIAGPRDVIRLCRRIRKMLGGGMRQAGIIAAGALYALEHNIGRMADDHEAASEFARTVADNSALSIDLATVQTNIVIMDVRKTGKSSDDIAAHMRQQGILFTTMGPFALRAVMHLDVARTDVRKAAEALVASYPG